MKLIFSLFIVLSAFSTFAQELAPTNPLIIGTWISDHPIYNRGVEIHTEFKFTATDMTLHATCVFPYQNTQLVVGVNSQVSYEDNNIYVLEKNQGSINDGFRYCNAGLEPATWQFYFKDANLNRAVLLAPIPYYHRFQLSRVEVSR